MTRNSKILLGVFIVCGLVLTGIIACISVFVHKYSKYDMKMGEAPDLYIVHGTSQSAKGIEGIFNLVLPDANLTDIHFSAKSVTGLLLSKEAFDSYEEDADAGIKKVFLPGFKAAILNAKMIAMLYNSAKQAEGRADNAYHKFEEFKKENGVAPNAAIRIAYSDLTCIDYVPVDISYEEIGKIFGLTRADE